MQAYSFDDTVKYLIGQSTANKPSLGRIHAINGPTVDIAVRGSKSVIRNLQVLGDIKTYSIGQIVNIQWQGNAPVVSGVASATVMSSGIQSSASGGGGSAIPDNVTLDYGPAGLEIKAGGIQLDRLAFTPSLVGHTHQDSLQKAGWQVDEDGVIYKNDVNINPNGQISLGLAPDLIKLDAAHAAYRIWVGDVDPLLAGFAVEKNGSAHIREGVLTLGGATAFMNGAGYFIGKEGGEYKSHIGDPNGDHLAWDGHNLNVSGVVISNDASLELEMMKMSFQSISWTQFAIWENFQTSERRLDPEEFEFPARVNNSRLDTGGDHDLNFERAFGFTSKMYGNITTVLTGTTPYAGEGYLADETLVVYEGQYLNYVLVDSTGATFDIAQCYMDGAAVLEFDGVAAPGAYSIRSKTPTTAIVFCSLLDCMNGGYGWAVLEVSFNGGDNWQTFYATEEVNLLGGAVTIENPGHDFMFKVTLYNDEAGNGPIVYKVMACTDPSVWG